MALRDRLARLEARLMPIEVFDRGAADRLPQRIASAAEAVEGVLGASDNMAALALATPGVAQVAHVRFRAGSWGGGF